MPTHTTCHAHRHVASNRQHCEKAQPTEDQRDTVRGRSRRHRSHRAASATISTTQAQRAASVVAAAAASCVGRRAASTRRQTRSLGRTSCWPRRTPCSAARAACGIDRASIRSRRFWETRAPRWPAATRAIVGARLGGGARASGLGCARASGARTETPPGQPQLTCILTTSRA